MEKKKAIILLVMAICIALTVGIAAYASVDISPEIVTAAPKYQYVAKFVCGNSTDTSLKNPVVPGMYRTSINIHNPQTANVSITKRVIQSSREIDQPKPPGKIVPYNNLQTDYAFEMDCEDIYSIGAIPANQQFSEGFITISSPKQIDVKVIHTAGALYVSGTATNTYQVSTMSVETINPKISVPVSTQYIDDS